jgi:site-specific recombinase XerD
MPKTSPSLKSSPSPSFGYENRLLPSSRLAHLVEAFLFAGDINGHSARTLESRRERLKWLVWWVERDGTNSVGADEVRRFLSYLRHGHKEKGGRFGNPRLKSEVSPGTLKAYHSTLRTFFNFCVAEGEVSPSPMATIPPPIDRPDQVQPFTDDEVTRLYAAARRHRRNHEDRGVTLLQRRDESMLMVMLDTGVRVTEMCHLTVGDVDFNSLTIRVRHGKGGKARTVTFLVRTRRALFDYLKTRGKPDADEPLFPAFRGPGAGDRLTRRGVTMIVGRWGATAGITRERCSPHTFRHTFAINFLRGGGDVFRLKELLGHTSLAMTNRYVALSNTDVTRRDASTSAVERILGGRKGKQS